MEFSLKNNKQLKTEHIYEEIKKDILTFKLSPGSVLNERHIAEKWESSRTPIREIFQKLENEGLIKKYPGQGTIVTEVTLRDIIEIFQLRQFLEPPAAAIVAAQLDNQSEMEFKEIAVTFASLEKDEPSKEISSIIYKTDALMHSLIITKTGNTRLIDFTNNLNNIVQRISYLGTPGRVKVSISEHLSIINALINRDSAKAEESMRYHLHESKKRLMERAQ